MWAAARLDRIIGWGGWRRTTLQAHATAYPAIWEGTLSEPDAWNTRETIHGVVAGDAGAARW